MWQAPQILNLLREQLGRLTLEAPVIAVTLLAPDTTEQPAASTTLFPEPGGTAADHARPLGLLTARLGRALNITQGVGSQILTAPQPEGWVEIGGRVRLER